jgi:putative transposase
MARPLRLEYPGAIWHVTSRGNARQDIVLDDVDRSRWVEELGRVTLTANWRIYAWVLMSNHHHLLVETPEANLARGMRQLNGVCAQAFNQRHGRVGHLFQGRYKGILVEREGYLLELVRYIVLNPVRAAMVRTPAQYRWSSYRETVGLRKAEDWLEVDWTLTQFGSGYEAGRRRFRQFVSEGRNTNYRPWDELRRGVFLGSERFLESLAQRAQRQTVSVEVPRVQRDLTRRPSLKAVERQVRTVFGAADADMVRRSRHPARKAFALVARRAADCPLAEIAGPLGLAPRSASSLLSAAEALEVRDPTFRQRVLESERQLRRRGQLSHHPET